MFSLANEISAKAEISFYVLLLDTSWFAGSMPFAILPTHDMLPTPQFTTRVATYANHFRLSAAVAPEECLCPWCWTLPDRVVVWLPAILIFFFLFVVYVWGGVRIRFATHCHEHLAITKFQSFFFQHFCHLKMKQAKFAPRFQGSGFWPEYTHI